MLRGHRDCDMASRMAATVTSLDEDTFFEFVAKPGPNVVFLSAHPLHPFSTPLGEALEASFAGSVQFGTISLFELALSRSPVLHFIGQRHGELTGSGAMVVPGYYLFRESELLSFDVGLPIRMEVNSMWKDVALTAVWCGVTRQGMEFAKSVFVKASSVCAPRIARDMREAWGARERAGRPSTGSARPSKDELRWAYDVLGVDVTASDAEVNAAWRRLRAAHHPDYAASDAAEFERRTRISQDLNRAREVIFAHRSRERAA